MFRHRRRSPGLSAAFKQSSLHLVKVLLHLGAADDVLEISRLSLADFFSRKNSALHPDLLEEFLRRYPETGWKLREDILDFTDKALNGHRQSQAFQLLDVLIHVMSTKVCLIS